MFLSHELALLIIISFATGLLSLCLAILCCKQSIELGGWRPCFWLWLRFFWALLTGPCRWLWRRTRCCWSPRQDAPGRPDLPQDDQESAGDSLAVNLSAVSEEISGLALSLYPRSPSNVAVPLTEVDYTALTPIARRSRFPRPYDWPRDDPPSYEQATARAASRASTTSGAPSLGLPSRSATPSALGIPALAQLPQAPSGLVRTRSAPTLAFAGALAWLQDAPETAECESELAAADRFEPVGADLGYVRLSDLLVVATCSELPEQSTSGRE